MALGCAINDVLDFGGHFLSLGRVNFFKRWGFSTATPDYAQNSSMSEMACSRQLPSRTQIMSLGYNEMAACSLLVLQQDHERSGTGHNRIGKKLDW